jgi:hypothetical protein
VPVRSFINASSGGVGGFLRSASGRAVYALVLWVLAFSALEQFAELSRDFGISPRLFHSIACAIALGAALFESATLRGLAGLRHLWERPDPIVDIAQRKCTYRAALFTDLQKVRKLAIKRYGWAFPLQSIQRWHQCNPKCLFLMFHEGTLVGYVDAFPISDADYRSLLRGGEERLITPVRETDVDATMSFYIASLVMDEKWGAMLSSLLKKAVHFYSSAYPDKPWTRLCAIGYSPAGRSLLEAKEMRVVIGDSVAVQMYSLDAAMLPGLRKVNRRFWQRLLPQDPPA